MEEKIKKDILDLLQNLSYAYEKGMFWKEWAELHKYVSDVKVIKIDCDKENNSCTRQR